ncbi:hypothetical protein NPS01_43210 [Nocardioides psychrotolerans]|uniref:Imelysin n=1 Tax=Nocardioides psychrotolerans TaxID=1005945 RepID=A0A1I3Q236_9ACTN|nr:hypothetical protein [Nocardioides psychrotolerans]GEP40658.1 hypothetical protein NPS01_43210 [Nocardioides psychrotolerans]SFJ27511.1 hypothetical protein SAMN05216561_1235 [Nocardioides psychrotolerans]
MRHHPLPRPLQLTAAALLALVLAGGLSACGGDDAGETSTTSETTDEADEPTEDTADTTDTFVADANAVCAGLYPDINAVGATLDPADPTTVTTDFLPLVQELQDELVVLTPPEDLAADYDAVLAEQQVNLDAITADPAALFEIDGGATNEAFDALGLTTCGSGSAG